VVPKELITLPETMQDRMLRESILAKVDSGAVGLICRLELVPSQVASSLQKLGIFLVKRIKIIIFCTVSYKVRMLENT